MAWSEIINFSEIAMRIATISPILIVGCIVTWLLIGDFSWKEVLAIKICHNKKRDFSRLIVLWIIFSAPLCFLSSYTLYLTNNINHIYNIWGIIIVLALLTFVRLWLESYEIAGEGRSPWIKSAFDFAKKIILVLSSYPATLTSIPTYRFSALIVSIFLIIIVFKYRIYDDVIKYKLYNSNSKRYISALDHSHLGQHTVLRGLLDHIPRAYIYASYSFSNIGLLLVGPDISNGNFDEISNCAFNISNNCNNIFVDFFYFNIVTIATVGYGDISPKSVLAKIICSFEIVFGVVVLATVLSLIVGRVQSLATLKEEDSK